MKRSQEQLVVVTELLIPPASTDPSALIILPEVEQAEV